MGFLDRLLGRDKNQTAYGQAGQTPPSWGSPGGYQQQGSYPPPQPSRPGAEPGSDQQADQAAIARYRYMLKTAPPERIEEAHAEAFAKLSPDQRAMVLSELSNEVPAAERARTDSPRDLARMATRAEMRNPGTLERSFNRPSMGGGMGGLGGGMGMGGMIAGSLLAGVAGAFVGTAIADAMFDDNDFQEGYEAGADDSSGQDNGQDGGQDSGQNQDDPGQDEADAGGFGDFGGGGDDFGDFGGGDY